MRRGLVFVLALVLGLALLYRGLIAYGDYLADRSAPAPAPAQAATAVTKVSPPPLAEMTEPEVQQLVYAGRREQLEMLARMRERRPTARMLEAIDQARVRSDDRAVVSGLTCLQVQAFPEDAFALALRTLPREKKAYAWNVDEGTLCLLRALGQHAARDPVAAREVLLLGVFSDNASVRREVTTALARIDLPDIPAELKIAAHSPSDHHRMFAVQAALALNALERSPAIVERAILDDYHGVASAARAHLERSDNPAAPRMVARLLARHGSRKALDAAFAERERTRHDVTPQILALANDIEAPTEERAAAIDLLAIHGDVGMIDGLVALRDSQDPLLQPRAIAAIMALEARRARGEKPRQ